MPGHISPDLQPLAPSHTHSPLLPPAPALCVELNPAGCSRTKGVFAQILVGRETAAGRLGLDPWRGRWKRGRRGWGSFPPCQDYCESKLGKSSVDKIRRGFCPTSHEWDVLSHTLLSVVVLAASCAGTEGGWQCEPRRGTARTAAPSPSPQGSPLADLSVRCLLSISGVLLSRCAQDSKVDQGDTAAAIWDARRDRFLGSAPWSVFWGQGHGMVS